MAAVKAEADPQKQAQLKAMMVSLLQRAGELKQAIRRARGEPESTGSRAQTDADTADGPSRNQLPVAIRDWGAAAIGKRLAKDRDWEATANLWPD